MPGEVGRIGAEGGLGREGERAAAEVGELEVFLRGHAVPTRSLNQKPHLSGQFWFSTPKVRPDPLFGPENLSSKLRRKFFPELRKGHLCYIVVH